MYFIQNNMKRNLKSTHVAYLLAEGFFKRNKYHWKRLFGFQSSFSPPTPSTKPGVVRIKKAWGGQQAPSPLFGGLVSRFVRSLWTVLSTPKR